MTSVDPASVRVWIRIGRDIAIAALAVFMLAYETVVIVHPNPLIVGAGLTLLGLPVAFRLDNIFRIDPNGDDGDPRSTRK